MKNLILLSAALLLALFTNAQIVITPTATDCLCYGDCNGSIDITITGGTSPYSYLWSNGDTIQFTDSLCAGPYSVTVTDNIGSTETASATISEPSLLTASISSFTNVSCNGACDGEIAANVTGGTLDYSYQWDDPFIMTSQTITGLCEGTYCVTVSDANNCTVIGCRTLTDPPIMVLSAIITEASCNQSDGAINLTITNGTAMSIVWSPGGYTTEDISNIPAGTYTVTVTDILGCTVSGSYIVPDLTGPTASITTSTNVDCYGNCNGMASVEGTGGNVPYTYLWSDGQSTITATNLCAGMYTATVTDATGCLSSVSVEITQTTELQLLVQSVTPATCGLSDGSATLSQIGGMAGYTINWSNGGTGLMQTNLIAGTYTASITNTNGCTADTVVNINNLNGPQISSVTTTDVTCFGGMNGTATLAYNPSSPPAPPYTTTWSSSGNPSTTETNLTGGTYSVTVGDNNGCISSSSFIIDEPNPIVIYTDGPFNPICIGQSATITVAVSGGTPPYTYIWADTTLIGNAPFVSPMATSLYQFYIVDTNGCISPTTSVVVNVYPALFVIVSPDEVICQGEVHTITAYAAGGNGGPYTYMWNNGNTQSSNVVSPIITTTYSVSVYDDCGSPYVSDNMIVTVIQAPQLVIMPLSQSGQAPLTASFDTWATSYNGTVEYLWNFGDLGSGVLNTSTDSVTTHTYANPGIYDVTLSLTSNPGNCQSIQQFPGLIVVGESGVYENDSKQFLSIFPNPTTGPITINNEELRIKNVAVYDIYGKEVLKQEVKSQKYEVDLSNQPNGIYIVKVITDKQTIRKKIIKQ